MREIQHGINTLIETRTESRKKYRITEIGWIKEAEQIQKETGNEKKENLKKYNR